MDSQNFLQTGGWPLKLERLNDMQNAYSIFNQLGFLAGNLTILYGCEATGTTNKPGFVFIDGEIYPFEGGTRLTRVRVIETKTAKEFENGESKDIISTKKVVFTSTVLGSLLWSAFDRIEPIKSLQRRILPPGTNPQLYSGSVNDIPTGWVLCNGANGTPDLRGRFIVGYDPADNDYNQIGKVGGNKNVTLLESQMPKHKHPSTVLEAGDHKHNGLSVRGSNADVGDPGAYIITANSQPNNNQENAGETAVGGKHTHTITMDEMGGGQGHENRPPYYTLAYIIYKG